MAGQRDLLNALPAGPGATAVLDRALAAINTADELADILHAEAQAAEAYWNAWSPLALPFSANEEARVPAHWLRFGQRRSLLTRRGRTATNPAGAMLNYLYSLLEGETILACHAVGLDPGMGIVHADRRSRSSFALDVMEAARPLVDQLVLQRLTQSVLAAQDFIETRQGACRLKPALAGDLAGALPTWRRPVAEIVEQVAHTFAANTSARVPHLTPLTRSNYHAGWTKRRASEKTTVINTSVPAALGCCVCGGELPKRGRARYCDECRRERATQHMDTQRPYPPAAHAQRRAENRDPAHGGRAGQLRAAKNAAHQRAATKWTGPIPDPTTFASDILPGLQTRTVSELVAATGLSHAYCTRIRRGKMIPHPRHWPAFKRATV